MTVGLFQRLLEWLRGSEQAGATRRLAFELAMRAAELADEGAPGDIGAMATPVILQQAGAALGRAADQHRRQVTELEKALAVEKKENARLGEQPSQAVEPPPLVGDLINLADQLAARSSTDPALVRWLDGRIVEILRRFEVSRISEEGAVDATRHEVIDVRPATEPGHAERIAGTVRPGYAWHGMILRPQQVIAYGERK
jgi:molecular chaperone GrpE (heat shock protein)